jgi:hypothetical protein
VLAFQSLRPSLGQTGVSELLVEGAASHLTRFDPRI